MVLAAPLFLASQTRVLRDYAARHREPLLRIGLGAVVGWLSLRLLAKTVRPRAARGNGLAYGKDGAPRTARAPSLTPSRPGPRAPPRVFSRAVRDR